MRMKTRYYPITLLVLAAALLAACRSGGTGELKIVEPWARPGTAGGNSAVYFTIQNGTDAADALLSASDDLGATAELHQSVMKDDGTMSMQPQENVPIPANGEVKFEPGGLHVMLINLPEDLAPGDNFHVTLSFEQAGEMTFEVPVQEH